MANLSDPIARSCLRKAAWRLLPLLFGMYVISYLDRANAGFAKLQMESSLHFSPSVFGLGFGLFFIGYLLFEIPGALLVEHWSARKWFTRILVTWGICSMGTALVETETEFYVARFLLGLTEAGFFPGVIVYFTHWFPREVRARAMSGMLIAVPVSLSLGAFVSALLLKLNWLGLEGWQWVFILEGAPAVLLGIGLPFLLTDRPRDAKWLTVEERDWLERVLAAERRESAAAGNSTGLGQALRTPVVWLLALGIFATNLGGYGVVSWLPTAVKGFLGGGAGDTEVLLWTGPVFLFGIGGVLFSGWWSHRTGERRRLCVAAQICAGLCWAASAITDQPWASRYAFLCLAGFFSNAWFTPFWVLPTLALSSSAAAVSIGFINMFANFSGFVSNDVVGEMKEAGLSDNACMRFLAGGFLIGGILVGLVRTRTNGDAPNRERQA